MRVFGGEGVHVRGAGRDAKRAILGGADHPLARAGERQRERHLFGASGRHRDVRHRDVGASFRHQGEQFADARGEPPFGAQPVPGREGIGDFAVLLGGKALRGQRVEAVEGASGQAHHAPLDNRLPAAVQHRRRGIRSAFAAGRGDGEREQRGEADALVRVHAASRAYTVWLSSRDASAE